MTTIEKIRAEIERRKEQAKQHYDQAYSIGRCDAFSEMLNFIDALEESEKPMNQEELEDEIERYLPTIQEEPYNEELRVFARHFAKWGAEHANGSSEIPNDMEEAAEEESTWAIPEPTAQGYAKRLFFKSGFKRGAKWQKEQSLMENHKAWMDYKSSMIKQIEKAEWQGYDKGLADGTVLGKEQMMKEAVEVEVWNYSSDSDLRALPLWGIDKFNNLEDGDKVRVIVLPKE